MSRYGTSLPALRAAVRRSAAGFCVALAGAMAANSAHADFVFDLGTGNVNLAGFAGPFAQVDVHLTDTTHAAITFTGLVQGTDNYLFGSPGAVAVNVNGAASISDIVGSNDGAGFLSTHGAGLLDLTDGSPALDDGFGSFDQAIDSFDSYKHSSDVISFVLTKTSGGWSSEYDVLTANAKGNIAAARVFVSPSNDFSSSGALAMGYAGASSAAILMEPVSIGLFAVALLGLGIGPARRRRAAPAT